jgi:RNA-directed DNA polymerase
MVETPKPLSESSRGTARVAHSASQATLAWEEPTCDWAKISMEQVVCASNLRRAYDRVRKNKGKPGVDGMSVNDLGLYLQTHWPTLKEQLLTDRYQPQAVLKVEIPKAQGGKRMLGIPTVVDRLIAQALLQVLQPYYETVFSDNSFGFRPGRSTHQAVLRARSYVEEGYRWVVDMDLEKFFDRVNHDILMSRLAKLIGDKRILRLIRRYLQAGIMTDGVVSARTEGQPQGSPLSPLLSNILLDDLDKELERRGHRFVRYADDSNVYVKSGKAGERVLNSITTYLSKRLKLVVNQQKSAVDRPWKRSFLGYTVTAHRQPKLKVAPKAIKRFKQSVKELLRQGRGRSLKQVIAQLEPKLRGWINYFHLAEVKVTLEALDQWVRRRLRLLLWRQWKKPRTRAKRLTALGIDRARALISAYNGHGPWWNSGASHMNQAVPTKRFRRLGLISLLDEYQRLACLL